MKRERLIVGGAVLAALPMIVALFAVAGSAKAADKGSACCADLEERVSELEASVARKGNRKVTVTLYGQVNKSVLWHDIDDTTIPKKRVIDGSQSPTLFGVTGEGRIHKDWKAGFRLEFEVNERAGEEGLTSAFGGADGAWLNGQSNPLSIRHSHVWLEGPMGKITLGKASMATDGAAEVTVANTDVAAKMLNLEPLSTNYLGGQNLPFDGSRRNIVRYDSPTFQGFFASASWGTGDNFLGLDGTNYANTNVWDVALRYAGEFGGFRVAGAVGYRNEDYAVFPTGLSGLRNRNTSLVGSASVKHVVSGLFVSAAAGRIDGEFLVAGDRKDLTGTHVQAGWENKLFASLGNTTVFGEWARISAQDMDGKPTMLGLGIVQSIDAAAMDLYVSWRQIDTDKGDFVGFSGDEKINTFMAGARVRF